MDVWKNTVSCKRKKKHSRPQQIHSINAIQILHKSILPLPHVDTLFKHNITVVTWMYNTYYAELLALGPKQQDLSPKGLYT